MEELEMRFQTAAGQVQKLSRRPDNDTLLQLYALYKQATSGDVSGKRPGFTDPAGRLKYDSWAKRKGLSKSAAMQQYIDLAEKLLKQ